MILSKPLVILNAVHYQSGVIMISFAQVSTVQWSNTIPSQNIWFQVRIDLTLFHFNKDITTKALFDCGSQLDCIDHGFVLRNKLPKLQLPTPIRVKNVDGTIKFITHLFLCIGTVVHWILFHIMGCGNENIILGLLWLKKINLRINWATETVTIPRKTNQTEALNYKAGITQRTSYMKPTYHEFLPNEYEREKPEYPDKTFVRMIQGASDTFIPKFKKRGKKFILSI